MPYDHKVVTRKGEFFVAKLSDDSMFEARASVDARKRLVSTVGLIDGKMPGLTESLARGIVSRLGRRKRSRRPRR